MAKLTVSVDLSPGFISGIFGKPWLGSAPFVLSLLCFFLVFCEFRCGDKTLTQARGYQLVTGDSIISANPFEKTLNDIDQKLGEHTTLKPVKQHVPPQPWAIAAVALIALAGIVLWVRHRFASLTAGVSGLGAVVSLLVLRYQMVQTVTSEYEMIQVVFTFGFYLAFSLALSGALLALLRFFSPPPAEISPASEPNSDFGG